ncbi:MAG: hypothetical protein IIA40_03360 [SAR324 cluster bacterium]|nr:hypothetical protein [SAR324 cluster bacterium]
MLGILLELFLTKWATAKAHFLPVPRQTGGPIQGFFGQTGWTYDHILRFLEKSRGIGDKQIDASLATKPVISALMPMNNRIFIADPQPNQRAATGAANQCFHVFSSCGNDHFRGQGRILSFAVFPLIQSGQAHPSAVLVFWIPDNPQLAQHLGK